MLVKTKKKIWRNLGIPSHTPPNQSHLMWITRVLYLAIVIAAVAADGDEDDTPVWDKLLPDQAYVIKDGDASYKLYYAGEDFASINLATSPDGLLWTEYPDNPIITDGQYHATVHNYDVAFTGANVGSDPSSADMYYRIWYAGPTNYGIENWRYGESPDGIVWHNRVAVSQVNSTPLVWSIGCGVAYGIADGTYVAGATNTGTDWAFRIHANVQWELGTYAGEELVIAGFSENGYEWRGYDPTDVGYATPVFTPTHVNGDFDAGHVGWFKVIRHAADDWEAFYSGGNDTTYQRLNGIGHGRAVSADGLNWTRAGVVATTSDGVAWRNASTWMPSVTIANATHYRVYFLGSDFDEDNMGEGDWIWWYLGIIYYPRPLPPVEEPDFTLLYVLIPTVLGIGILVTLTLVVVACRHRRRRRPKPSDEILTGHRVRHRHTKSRDEYQ